MGNEPGRSSRLFTVDLSGGKPNAITPEGVVILNQNPVSPDGKSIVAVGPDSRVDRSEFAGTNKGTAALWEVDDVEGTVKELKSRGVRFEHYDDMPGLTRDGNIHPAGNILSVQSRSAGSKSH